MLLLLLTKLTFAETSTETNTETSEETPVIHTLLYSGTDDQASLVRTSLAADLSTEQLQLKTVVDLTGLKAPTFSSTTDGTINIETLSGCAGNPITNKHVQNYTQRADHHLNYYELEKSAEVLQRAEKSLVCLNELFNADDVRQMYYIKGILESTKENNEASKAAFSSAIRIKPDLQWNNIYSPDSKPNFDTAKSEYSSLVSVPLDIVPKEAASSLWINGTPLLDIENPTMFAGTNIIQIVGLETTTFEITVPSNVDSIQLVIPSTLPNTAYTWVESEERTAELSKVLNHVLEPEDLVYIHHSGRVWQNSIGSTEWTELEVPKFAEAKLNAKRITGQSLMWTGLLTSAVSIGLSTNYYVQGQTAYQASADTDDWEIFKGHRAELTQLESKYNASMLTLAGGLGLAGLGYSIAF